MTYPDRSVCADGSVAVAKEGAARVVLHEVIPACKGIDKTHSAVRNAEVEPVDAALGAVHSAAECAVAVIEQLGRQEAERGALFCSEDEFRDAGAVLSEIHYQLLAREDAHLLARGIFTFNQHLAVAVLRLAFDVLPDIGPDGAEGKVAADVHFSTCGRENLAREFVVQLRSGELFGSEVTLGNAGVILLAVEDVGVGPPSSRCSWYRKAHCCRRHRRVGAQSGKPACRQSYPRGFSG